jgi:hypothetical protein
MAFAVCNAEIIFGVGKLFRGNQVFNSSDSQEQKPKPHEK